MKTESYECDFCNKAIVRSEDGRMNMYTFHGDSLEELIDYDNEVHFHIDNYGDEKSCAEKWGKCLDAARKAARIAYENTRTELLG